MTQTSTDSADRGPVTDEFLVATSEATRRTISVAAPTWTNFVTGTQHQVEAGQRIGFPNTLHNDAGIRITVRELQGSELGTLNSTGPEFSRVVHDAVARKSAEDKATYGMTTDEIRARAVKDGYYDSPAHDAWAAAAEARTGGRLTAAWWKGFDPYGGTNGNGPNIMGGGEYPHALSRIGMAHDTDWSLGRHFGAGPMAALRGATNDSETLGKYGLDPLTPIRPQIDIYTDGHPDWNVRYVANIRRAQVDGDAPALATADPSIAPTRTGLHAQAYDKLPPGVFNDTERDNVALTIATRAQANGVTSIDHIVSSTQDPRQLFVVQGALTDPAHRKLQVDGAQAALQPVDWSVLDATTLTPATPQTSQVALVDTPEAPRVQRM